MTTGERHKANWQVTRVWEEVGRAESKEKGRGRKQVKVMTGL